MELSLSSPHQFVLAGILCKVGAEVLKEVVKVLSDFYSDGRIHGE
jgi:hypothetical protein